MIASTSNNGSPNGQAIPLAEKGKKYNEKIVNYGGNGKFERHYSDGTILHHDGDQIHVKQAGPKIRRHFKGDLPTDAHDIGKANQQQHKDIVERQHPTFAEKGKRYNHTVANTEHGLLTQHTDGTLLHTHENTVTVKRMGQNYQTHLTDAENTIAKANLTAAKKATASVPHVPKTPPVTAPAVPKGPSIWKRTGSRLLGAAEVGKDGVVAGATRLKSAAGKGGRVLGWTAAIAAAAALGTYLITNSRGKRRLKPEDVQDNLDQSLESDFSAAAPQPLRSNTMMGLEPVLDGPLGSRVLAGRNGGMPIRGDINPPAGITEGAQDIAPAPQVRA